MSIHLRYIAIALLAVSIAACSTSKKTASEPKTTTDLSDMRFVELEPMVVRPDDVSDESDVQAVYRPTRERVWDLLHTSLDLSFDWEREAVIGRASLTLTPVFYPQETLRLDAVDFDIHAVRIDGQPTTSYTNDGEQILINLGRLWVREEVIEIDIDYTAIPRAGRNEEDSPIKSDRGLFFIDPHDTIPGLPRQIWTQGETSFNSRWFPTLDQPNERATQEIVLTVADTFQTLSNGVLMSSEKLPNGMRRDHWKLELPHAPYLAMIAVGQWDVETDYWRGRPVDYFVDPGYGESARAIFAHTPEMLEFFSTILGYEYVWPKYAQVVVKEFVSGAMENTTAVVFGDFILFDKEERMEPGPNDYIVAHELFHHWFGDLVTCESWSNLVLNEGFANYAEYLWTEYKFGKEKADMERQTELEGYFAQADYNPQKLVRYYYGADQEMFDAHSYNKGGLVLHMLRDFVGDEAFYASLNYYLREHAFGATEVADLRQAFEEVTGKDLHWFFDQWYFELGHPVLKVTESFDHVAETFVLKFEQQQEELGYYPTFRLPIEIAFFHRDGSVENREVWLENKTQEFTFDISRMPLTVVIDPRDILLAMIDHETENKAFKSRVLSKDLAIIHRVEAFHSLEQIDDELLYALWNDSSYTMQSMIINRLTAEGDVDRLVEMSELDAINETADFYRFYMLAGMAPERSKDAAIRLLEKTENPLARYVAIRTLAEVDLDEALHQVSHLNNPTSPTELATKVLVYSRKEGMTNYDMFVAPPAARLASDLLQDFVGSFAGFLAEQPEDIQIKGFDVIASNYYLEQRPDDYRRFYIITGLLSQYNPNVHDAFQMKLLNAINKLYKQETNSFVKQFLQENIGELLD